MPPPKEGRYQPYRTGSPQRTRTTTKRIILLAIIVVLSYSVLISLLVPSLHEQAVQKKDTTLKKSKRELFKPERVIKTHPSVASSSKPKKQPESDGQDHRHPVRVPPQARQDASRVQVVLTDNHKNKDGEETRFKKALQHVLSVLPGDIHQRELLRPFEGTGKEKLQKVGMKARAFKGFFEAWESLHLVSSGKTVSVRNDVVEDLRCHLGVASSSTLEQTVQSYEDFRSFLQRLATLLFPWTSPNFSDLISLHAKFHKGGRGIVIPASDHQAPYLFASIPSFRRLGCTIPIEIMYLGDNDLAKDQRTRLEALPGVTTRDLTHMIGDEEWRLTSWAIKPFAILLSSFREVIFVDADALFFQNPESLFDDPLYKETGALFFKDRHIMPESRKGWLQQILPKSSSQQDSGHMHESGVVVVDKWRHFVAMLLVTRTNGLDPDGNEDVHGMSDMVSGTKGTFWIGWELVGDLDYAFHSGDNDIMVKVEAHPHAPKGGRKSGSKSGSGDNELPEQPDSPFDSTLSAEDVLVVLKTGASEVFERLPEQLLTLAKHIPNFMVFSDLEQDIGDYHIHSALDDVSDEYKNNNEDFVYYRSIEKAQAEHQDLSKWTSEKGWDLDKWKNIPMLHKVYQERPDTKWFVFIDADTFISWTNLLQLLSRLDPTEPLYFGSAYNYGNTTFAQGGTGYVVSNAAARKFEDIHSPEYTAKWENETETNCCGDVMLAVAMLDAGVNLTGAWPLVQSDSPSTIDWSDRIWCTPSVSWHHVRSYEIEALWHFERTWVKKTEDQGKVPYLYKDLFDHFIQPYIVPNRSDWNNLSQDRTFTKPAEDHPKEGTQWDDLEDEEKQTLWEDLSEIEHQSIESPEACYAACEAWDECLQYFYRPGSCHLDYVVRLGKTVDAKKENGTVSGWMPERIQQFKERQPECVPAWDLDS